MNYTGPKLNPFQTVGYAVLVGVTFLLSRLPLGFHRRAGDFLGFVAGKVIRYRRDVAVKNISRAFPDKDMDWIEETVSKFYRQFGRIFAEAIWFGSCTDAEKLKKSGIIRLSNPEALNGYYHAGRSVVVLFSHSSNWEIMAGYPCVGGGLDVDENDVFAVFKRQSMAVWDRFFFRNRIAPFGKDYDGLKEAGEILHCALANADVPRIYNFLNDQRPPMRAAGRVTVEFMGQKTEAMTGAVKLAAKIGAPVMYMSMKPDGSGSYVFSFTELCGNAADVPVQDLVEKYYRCLENDLRETPWNYLWTHKRWS